MHKAPGLVAMVVRWELWLDGHGFTSMNFDRHI